MEGHFQLEGQLAKAKEEAAGAAKQLATVTTRATAEVAAAEANSAHGDLMNEQLQQQLEQRANRTATVEAAATHAEQRRNVESQATADANKRADDLQKTLE